MALYKTGLMTTASQYVADIKEVAEANGWTIDFFGLYNTYNRLHFSKAAGSHFEVWATSATAFSFVGCTGYSSGSAPTAQPGVNTTKTSSYVTSGGPFAFISVVGGIYFGHYAPPVASWVWAGAFMVQQKIGTWAGGACTCLMASSGLFLGISSYGPSSGVFQIHANGAWTPTVYAGGASGSVGSDTDMMNKQPCEYNAAIVPVPVSLFIRLLTDGSKLQPVGFAPGIYRCNGGDIYSVGESITVGADTYLIYPSYGAEVGSASHDFLFKLGA